jgi:chlorophyllase-like protein
MSSTLFAVAVALCAAPATAQVDLELAGNSVGPYPFFEYVRAFNADASVKVAIDPTRFPGIVGQTCDIYVVNDKSAAGWAADPSLMDVRPSGAQTVTFVGGGIQDDTFTVAGPGQLQSSAGTTAVGRGYDVVLDCDQNASLGPPDYIDGRVPDRGGLYVVHDLTVAGPLATTSVNYNVTGVTAGFESERTFYPSNIASMGQLPLIIISHGNGHNYTWYDYLQSHLASYGYIVMSHENNTQAGIEAASTTTLQHTDAIIGQQATIAGGVLNGHINSSKIVWIGHSRGGEGVTRAYDRITDNPPSYNPTFFTAASIQLISSIAPTDFLGPNSSNPKTANYHFIYGAADGDVSGDPGNDIADAFNIFERAEGFRDAHYLQGVGHNEFNCCGTNDATGPNLIGRPAAQTIARGYFLAVVKRYLEGSVAAKDFLWRQYEQLRPMGALATAVVDLEYKEPPSTGKFVIDDYQTQPAINISSSGGTVTTNTENNVEGVLNDNNTSFTWTTTDPMNGMTRARSGDATRGTVFDAAPGARRLMEWSVVPGAQDFSTKDYLSFRACQGTRHPLTIAHLGDAAWLVQLLDGSGHSSRIIRFSAYGGGIEEPYQRTGAGTGAGWQNEFETIRVRLTDFLTNDSTLDLSDIVAVRMMWRTDNERVGFDDLEVTTDP